jgi:hypothetical protein
MICGLYGDQKEIVKEKTTYLEIFDELIFFQRFRINNSSLFNAFVCNLGFFWQEWASLKLECNESFKGPRVFLFDEPLKGSKSLKMFKISLTFRFDKLSNLSKSAHTGENSQILTVPNKKDTFFILLKTLKVLKLLV